MCAPGTQAILDGRRRWDLDLGETLSFENKDWQAWLRGRVLQEGRRRPPEWIDYFVFTRGLYREQLPAFVVGRVFWDNWPVWKALDLKNPVVDASEAVMAVHQNHDYGYHPQGKTGVFHGAEAGRNHQLGGGWKHLRTIADASEVLREDGFEAEPVAALGAMCVRPDAYCFTTASRECGSFSWGLRRPVRKKFRLGVENWRQLRGKVLPHLGRHS